MITSKKLYIYIIPPPYINIFTYSHSQEATLKSFVLFLHFKYVCSMVCAFEYIHIFREENPTNTKRRSCFMKYMFLHCETFFIFNSIHPKSQLATEAQYTYTLYS